MLPTKRDYSLLGPDGRLAVEKGLATAQWYHTDVSRREMKALMQRRRALAEPLVDPVLPRLRRAVRLGKRFALA